MKKVLNFVLMLGLFVMSAQTIFAASEYDFIEYDVKTKEKKVISYDDMDFSDVPEKTDPRLPRGTRSIIGDDNREPVEDTTKFPYSSIVKINITAVNGLTGSCSGSLIAADTVLTAAHCVVEHDEYTGIPTILSGFKAMPGYNNRISPFGEAYATKYYYSKIYYESNGYAEIAHDIAIVKLDRNIGNTTGWLGLDPEPNRSDLFTHTGYGIPFEQLEIMKSETRDIPEIVSGSPSWNEETVRFLHDGLGGNSGGSIYDPNHRVGMVFSSSVGTYNLAIRVNEARFKMIYNIMNAAVPVENIAVSPTEAEIKVNEKISLTTTITPENATNKNVIYTSSDDSIATVSETGEVTGVSAGTVTITVTSEDGRKSANVQINVVPVVAKGIISIHNVSYTDEGTYAIRSEFKLVDKDGNVIRDEIKTTASGKAMINKLPEGEYYLVQTEVMDGYYLNTKDKRVIFSQNNVQNVIFENYKTQQEDKVFSGENYIITANDIKIDVKKAKTINNDEIMDLANVKAYLKDNEDEFGTVKVKENTVLGKEKGKYEIEFYVDEESTTKLLIEATVIDKEIIGEGIYYNIGAKGTTVGVKDAQDMINSDDILKEKTEVEAWRTDDASLKGTVKVNNKKELKAEVGTYEVEFAVYEDERTTVKVKIVVTNEDRMTVGENYSLKAKDIEIDTYDAVAMSDEEMISLASAQAWKTTNENVIGTVKISENNARNKGRGTYKVELFVEEEPSTKLTIKVNVVAVTGGRIILTNRNRVASRGYIEGSIFRLEDTSGNVIADNLVTDYKGEVTIKNLPEGEYNIIQVSVNDRFFINNVPTKVKIMNKSAVRVIFLNMEK